MASLLCAIELRWLTKGTHLAEVTDTHYLLTTYLLTTHLWRHMEQLGLVTSAFHEQPHQKDKFSRNSRKRMGLVCAALQDIILVCRRQQDKVQALQKLH